MTEAVEKLDYWRTGVKMTLAGLISFLEEERKKENAAKKKTK